jgi:hypothetical protein
MAWHVLATFLAQVAVGSWSGLPPMPDLVMQMEMIKAQMIKRPTGGREKSEKSD